MSQDVTITFRIPCRSGHPLDLIKRLPAGCKLTPEYLVLSDGTKVEFEPLPPDDQFVQIFASSCRRQPTAEEREIVENYQVNIILSGPGGSKEAAHKMMQAAAVMIQAGAGGVFIDNSGLAHGGGQWMYLTEDGGPDALSFAFVTIVRGDIDVHTIGMHCLGLRDIIMKRSDIEVDGYDIIEVIRYMAAGEKLIGDGHIIADLDGPRFRTIAIDDDSQSPRAMHNPFGRLRLVSMKDIADTN